MPQILVHVPHALVPLPDQNGKSFQRNDNSQVSLVHDCQLYGCFGYPSQDDPDVLSASHVSRHLRLKHFYLYSLPKQNLLRIYYSNILRGFGKFIQFEAKQIKVTGTLQKLEVACHPFFNFNML